MKQHRFRKGSVITEPIVVFQLLLQREWLFFQDKPMHPSWLLNWSVCTVEVHVRNRRISWAHPNINYMEKEHGEGRNSSEARC